MLETTETTEKPKGKKPEMIAYHVNKKEGQDKAYWNRTGAAWVHGDKKGLTIKMDDGREITLRKPKPKTEA